MRMAWFQLRRKAGVKPKPRRTTRPARSTRPAVEVLEDRRLLSGGINLFPVSHKPSSYFEGGDLIVGSDKNLWFLESGVVTGLSDQMIGMMTPTGQVQEFPLPSSGARGLAGITTGPDSKLWFSEFYGGAVGTTPTTGTPITEYRTSNGVGGGITPGPDGKLWVASGSQGGGSTTAYITSISTDGSQVSQYKLPDASGPEGITKGPDGSLWFAESAGNRIGRITTNGGLTEFPVPTANSGPGRITVGPGNNLWFTEFNSGKIGEITTSGSFAEFTIPVANSQPNGITEGPDGNLWITLEGTGQIARMTPTGSFSFYTIPGDNPGAIVPSAIVTGPDSKSLWFLAAGASEIGQLVLDQPLTATGSPIALSVAQGIVGTVATFTDADPAATAGSFTASILWGDGSASAGTISADPRGGFDVTGTHTYAQPGTYAVAATITDIDTSHDTAGSTAATRSTAQVAPAPPVPAPAPGIPLTGDVTSLVQVTLTPAPRNRKRKSRGLTETLTVIDGSGSPLQGPLSVVLRGLKRTLKLRVGDRIASGFVGTRKKKSPFVVINLAGGVLQPNGSVSLVVQFSARPNGLTMSVFAGTSPK